MTAVNPFDQYGNPSAASYSDPAHPPMTNQPMLGQYPAQPMGQPPMGQPMGHPMGQHMGQPMGHPMGHPMGQPPPYAMAAQPQPVMMVGMPMNMNMNPLAMLPPATQAAMSKLPVDIKCPFCQKQGPTHTELVTGARAYMTACFCTCMCFCCLLPLIWEGLKDTEHTCSHCNNVIATHVPRGGGGRRRRR